MSNENSTTNKPSRSYWFTLKLYPENKKHCAFMQKLHLVFPNSFYILHDKDAYPEDVKNEQGETIHVKGELKKPHWHIVLKIENAKTTSAFRKKITENYEIEGNLAKECDAYAMARYLTHSEYINDHKPDKYPYNETDVKGAINLYNTYKISNYNGDEFTALEKVIKVIRYKKITNLYDAIKIVHEHGLYNNVKKSYLLTRIIESEVKDQNGRRKDQKTEI